jgi:hypothetical protein
MKSKYCIYLLTLHPIFNIEKIPLFEPFDLDNSHLLYTSLLLNHHELLKKAAGNYKIVYCFDESDKDLIPSELCGSGADLIFGNSNHPLFPFDILNERYFPHSEYNIIILSSSIGYRLEDIEKAMCLLGMEDEVLIIGKSTDETVAMIGFNKYNNNLFFPSDLKNLKYEKFLERACFFDNFIYVLNRSFLTINSIKDFKDLYRELSKKESTAYCSQSMHEKFTHLFIEYKEILK